MTSPSIFGRFTNHSQRPSPGSQLRGSLRTSPSEYDLQELDPNPDSDLPDGVLWDQEAFPARRQSAPSDTHPYSGTPWDDQASSAGSASKLKPRPMFAGPPPPIASSILVVGDARPSASTSRNGSRSRKSSGYDRTTISGNMFYDRTDRVRQHPDSAWRGLRRREKALENEVQQLLDLQAAGLIAGSGGLATGGSDMDAISDAGSSTPTGTFYSTATSKSRMQTSLYVPTRSTADGNVIPVRQPTKRRQPGLRSARNGLRRSMVALAELKQEEDQHVTEAISLRKDALKHLAFLSNRRDSVLGELRSFEKDDQEPLGQELRELGATYESLSEEIRLLEERLVGMRNRRRWLRERIDDVQNRREAGLSGYRGALKSAESEIRVLLDHPPVQPLDTEVLQHKNEADVEVLSSGIGFLRLKDDRRTGEMARAWWEGELALLERRKVSINADQEALEQGSVVWQEVLSLVTSFESSLRQLMKTGEGSSPALGSSKGEETGSTQDEMIQDQLLKMTNLVETLEKHMQTAEDKQWNLLICAIGAEAEAFKEAQDMLKSALATSEEDAPEPPAEADDDGHRVEAGTHHSHGESDNEVPQDLLVSRIEESSQESRVRPDDGAVSQLDVDNNVPSDFLAEHEDSKLD